MKVNNNIPNSTELIKMGTRAFKNLRHKEYDRRSFIAGFQEAFAAFTLLNKFEEHKKQILDAGPTAEDFAQADAFNDF